MTKLGEACIEDFIVNAPLYSEINVARAEGLKFIQAGNLRISAHCIECQADTIFINDGIDPIRLALTHSSSLEGGTTIIFHCQKNPNHKLDLAINFRGEMEQDGSGRQFSRFHITKTGQFPSLLDLSRDQFKHIQGTADNLDYRELNRAVGLASHGVNVGAFIYLRRIFERQISSISKANGLHSEEFDSKRMRDKISTVEEFLPSILKNDKRIYGFLSAGVHEWTEEKCGTYFEILLETILLILEEQKVEKERQQRKLRLRTH